MLIPTKITEKVKLVLKTVGCQIIFINGSMTA